MPTDTPDQQITMPVDADAADNPLAFNQAVGDIEPKLVRAYVDEADRTARMLVLPENAISTLATENRAEIYNGSAHVSLYTRSTYARARKTGTQNVGPSNTVLQNVTDMLIALPAVNGAIFQFRGIVYYNSNGTADIKFAFTIPAGGATFIWNPIGIATTATGTIGDVNCPAPSTSGTAAAFGGAGVDSAVRFWGEITMGTVAGNLQLQAAQNTSDASTSNILPRSIIECWRLS